MGRIDIGRTVAIAWIVVAVGLTVLVGPMLGWRGWMWLGAHHVLCAVGAGHELWRKSGDRKRRNGDGR